MAWRTLLARICISRASSGPEHRWKPLASMGKVSSTCLSWALLTVTETRSTEDLTGLAYWSGSCLCSSAVLSHWDYVHFCSFIMYTWSLLFGLSTLLGLDCTGKYQCLGYSGNHVYACCIHYVFATSMPMDRGASWTTVLRVTKSQIWLSD